MDQRPVPSPTALTAPYWEACRRGELVVQRCPRCRRWVHFPRPACPDCGAEPAYERVSGRGKVHTFSVVGRTFLPGFAPPYTIAWIDLDEGVRVFGNVHGEARIGGPVRVCFDELPGFGPIPNWRVHE